MGGGGQLQPGLVGQGDVAHQCAIHPCTLHARIVLACVLRGDPVAQAGPGVAVGLAPPVADLAAGIHARPLRIDGAVELAADQGTKGAVQQLRARGIEYRCLQCGGGGDQAVLGDVVGQRRLLRQHVPAAVGIALADPLHFLAVAPGRGDQHVAAETAAAHRLHGVVQVAARGADLDRQRFELGAGLGLGRGAEPAAGIDFSQQRLAQFVDHQAGLAALFRLQVRGSVFAAEHRAGGHVDRLQHLLPARRLHAASFQHLAAEAEAGIAVAARQVRRHCIAHAPAQVGAPLFGLELADHRIQLGEQRRVGHRHAVVLDALGGEELVQLQVAVALGDLGHRYWGEIAGRSVEFIE